MTKRTRSGSRNGPKGNPNQDVQPWLGWIAAMLVVVIVVVAVAMGMQRTGEQRNNAAEVRMTPVVGGMQVPLATETSAVAVASEVTPLPEAMTNTVTNTGGVTMVTVITATEVMTAVDTFTMTGEMTPTESSAITATETLTVTETLTAGEISLTGGISVSQEVTPSVEATTEVTVEATAEPTEEPTLGPTPKPTGTEVADATQEPTETPTPRATPRPTATARPTSTPTVVVQSFETGDTVASGEGRVEIFADASLGALVLDSVGAGVALEVLDPSGDFDEYPVVADGHSWVRVRAADGLVGWVKSDEVEAQ